MPAMTLQEKAIAIALAKENEEASKAYILSKGQHTPADKYAGKIVINQKKIDDEMKQLERL